MFIHPEINDILFKRAALLMNRNPQLDYLRAVEWAKKVLHYEAEADTAMLYELYGIKKIKYL